MLLLGCLGIWWVFILKPDLISNHIEHFMRW